MGILMVAESGGCGPSNVPEVGSSAKMISGSESSSVATERRFRSPPDTPRMKACGPPMSESAHLRRFTASITCIFVD